MASAVRVPFFTLSETGLLRPKSLERIKISVKIYMDSPNMKLVPIKIWPKISPIRII